MAQQPVLLRHLDSRQGLVNNRVLVLEQDCFGRMWIGTPYGVSCYDGYFFTNFSRSECNNRHLSNNYAQDIIALDNGDVWIATPDSLNIYRYRDDRMQAEGTERGLTDTDITALYRSKDGSGIWLGSYGNGVIRYDFQTNRFSPLHFDGDSPHHVMCLNEDNNHHLWIGSRFEGVFRYDLLRGTLQKIELDAVTTVNAIHSDRNGTVWIGSDAGLYLYNAGQIRRVSLNAYRDAKIRTITEDDRGRIWIGSESGLWGVDTNTEYLHGTDILAEQEIGRQKNPDLLTYNSIHALCMIERDQLWVGTYGGGVDLISATPYAIQHLTPMKALGFTGQAADKTTSLCLDAAGNLLIGLDGHGVALYTGDGDYTYFSGDRIHDNHILALTEDARGRIWAGGYTKGLAMMNPDRRRCQTSLRRNDGCIRGILPVGDSLLLAMGNDLRIYDIRANRIRSRSKRIAARPTTCGRSPRMATPTGAEPSGRDCSASIRRQAICGGSPRRMAWPRTSSIRRPSGKIRCGVPPTSESVTLRWPKRPTGPVRSVPTVPIFRSGSATGSCGLPPIRRFTASIPVIC